MARAAGAPAHLPFFVYGTLLPGQPNHGLWGMVITAMRPAMISGFELLDLTYYPMMVRAPGQTVRGLVIDVEPGAFGAVVAGLDYLEGFDPANPNDSEYRREKQIARLANGRELVAWTYVGHPASLDYPRVRGGDWKAHVSASEDASNAWWAGVATVGRL